MDSESDSTWIHTGAALPINGQPVEFMLDARECPMTGTYSDGRFLSRWTRYAPELVCKWRGTFGEMPAPASPAGIDA